jgi:hypothetical protein
MKKVKNEDTNSKINFTKERLDYGLELMSQISYIMNMLTEQIYQQYSVFLMNGKLILLVSL